MNFVFVSTMYSAPWGGSEELWSQAAMKLRREGHEVLASTVFWPTASQPMVKFAQSGIPCITHSARHGGLFRRLGHKLMLGEQRDFRALAERNPDLVIISQGDNSDGLSCMKYCRDYGLPFVVIVQSNAEAWWPRDKEAFELAKAYRAARNVYCVSQRNLELLQRQVGEDLPNGEVINNPFSVPTDLELSWPRGDPIFRFACVARLDPVAKGHDLLFRVLADQHWRERPVEINLFGAGPCELGLRRMAARLGLDQVRFRGHVSDIKAIWAENQILILPSRIEGLPISLVEAMWCARPVLVTDVGGNAEACLDRETGFVASAPTAEILGQTMEEAWNCRQDWEKMGKAARSRIEKLVSKDPVGEFCLRLIANAHFHRSAEK